MMETDSTIQIGLAPLLVDAAVVGRLLGVSRKTVYNLLADGRLGPLPVRTLGRRTLWRTSELQAWVSAGCPSREVWIDLQKSERICGRKRILIDGNIR